mgnify:CR=1 FL=1
MKKEQSQNTVLYLNEKELAQLKGGLEFFKPVTLIKLPDVYVTIDR